MTVGKSDVTCCFVGYPQPPPLSDRPEVVHYSVQLDASNGEVLFHVDTQITKARIMTVSQEKYHIIRVAAVNALGSGVPATITGLLS